KIYNRSSLKPLISNGSKKRMVVMSLLGEILLDNLKKIYIILITQILIVCDKCSLKTGNL
ncbi:MAG: hypothetical protein ABIJ94_00210, partial [candidate division WOR-3 bacterium]